MKQLIEDVAKLENRVNILKGFLNFGDGELAITNHRNPATYEAGHSCYKLEQRIYLPASKKLVEQVIKKEIKNTERKIKRMFVSRLSKKSKTRK